MDTREEFKKRVAEVDSFYEILYLLELENPHIAANKIEDTGVEKIELKIDSLKIDTLRSTAYLLLYNLIESTVYNSIISIFDEINDQGLKYFNIIEELQKYWLNNHYKHDEKKKKETIVESIVNIVKTIFNNTIRLASNEINYGGSLDAKAIMKTADSIQINIANVRRLYKENQHGQALLDIKNKRNLLAHGEKSFTEVGSGSSFDQLQEAKTYVISFLSEYIVAVEEYIEKQQYQKPIDKEKVVFSYSI